MNAMILSALNIPIGNDGPSRIIIIIITITRRRRRTRRTRRKNKQCSFSGRKYITE